MKVKMALKTSQLAVKMALRGAKMAISGVLKYARAYAQDTGFFDFVASHTKTSKEPLCKLSEGPTDAVSGSSWI